MARLPFLRAGSGPTMVFVHGYLGGARQWQAEIARFAADFDVIAPNLPGFGAAHAVPYCTRIEDMAAQVLDLLDDLEVTEFVLIGHSMGGMIAQQMAATRPEAVRRLVLYATGPLGLMPDRFEPLSTSRSRLEADGVAATIRRIGATWFKKGEAAPELQLLVDIGTEAHPAAAMGALDAMEHWDGRAALGRLTMPTLVLWGDSDQSYRWPQIEILWSQIPDAQLSVVPDTAHAVHLERPEIFHSLLRDFVLGEGADATG